MIIAQIIKKQGTEFNFIPLSRFLLWFTRNLSLIEGKMIKVKLIMEKNSMASAIIAKIHTKPIAMAS